MRPNTPTYQQVLYNINYFMYNRMLWVKRCFEHKYFYYGCGRVPPKTYMGSASHCAPLPLSHACNKGPSVHSRWRYLGCWITDDWQEFGSEDIRLQKFIGLGSKSFHSHPPCSPPHYCGGAWNASGRGENYRFSKQYRPQPSTMLCIWLPDVRPSEFLLTMTGNELDRLEY